MSTLLDATEIAATAISPEQRLFVGVILNAAIEAAGRGIHISTDDRERNQAKAYAWFREATDDFEMVCSLAGLEADRVRLSVLQYADCSKADPQRQHRRANLGKRHSGRVTVNDVAEHAQVSPTSVHNALRNHATPRVANLVNASIAALGYERPQHVN